MKVSARKTDYYQHDLTLMTTSSLSNIHSYNLLALLCISQKGNDVVQKSNNSSDAPSLVSGETDSANAPDARCDCHRFTNAVRFETSVSDGGDASMKKSDLRSDVKSVLKSGGVTSETNQGIDLGLGKLVWAKETI